MASGFRQSADEKLRQAIRLSVRADEKAQIEQLAHRARPSEPLYTQILSRTESLVGSIRAQEKNASFFDAFLQEYGLDNDEGIELMRLAEAFMRTPDENTRNALLKDRIAAGGWSKHRGEMSDWRIRAATEGLCVSKLWFARNFGLISSLGNTAARTITQFMMARLAEHFVLGRTIEEAVARSQSQIQRGYTHSFDMLGEAARTMQQAERYFLSYMDAIKALSGRAVDEDVRRNPGISIKLSAIYPRYEFAQRDIAVPALVERVKSLSIAAMQANIPLTIDAEESDRLEISLDIISRVLEDSELGSWDGFGIVVQAYQRRAIDVLEWLIEKSRQRGAVTCVRLVKGAYWDQEIKNAQEQGLSDYPVFTRKAHTDISYLACARLLLQNTDAVYPQFATHNAHSAAATLEFAESLGVPFDAFEFQRLHGMGEALHDELQQLPAIRSRIYAPAGEHKDLLAYLVRRLLENGANSSFLNRLYNRDIPAREVGGDPFSIAEEKNYNPNQNITAPRDRYSGERMAAEGVDLNDPLAAYPLETAITNSRQANLSAASIIDGSEVTGATQSVINPANPSDLIGRVSYADAHTVERAIACAQTAWNEWRSLKPQSRAKPLAHSADLLEERRDLFVSLLVREAGKTIPDAVADWREAIDFLRYYSSLAANGALEGRSGHGIIACISPWNFPLAIFVGQAAGALAAGNTVVAKPAEQTSLIAAEAVRLLHEAGIPRGALNLLAGRGETVGAALVSSAHIDGVCFTGSLKTAQAINQAVARRAGSSFPFIAETGGVNAMIVDSSALLEQAVDDIVASAFQSAGQRCSALRLLCVQDDVADDLFEMLSGAINTLRVGDPARLSTDIGPVIDQEAFQSIAQHIQMMRKTARLIGEAPAADADGIFVRPIAFEIGAVSQLKAEVFGPVLHAVRYTARDFEALVDTINATGFGLTMGLHTRLDSKIRSLAAQARVGNIYCNRNQIGAIVGVQPFGGEGLSGTGPKAGGPLYLRRLSKPAPSSRPNHMTGRIVAQRPGDTASAPNAAQYLHHASHKPEWRDWKFRQAVFLKAGKQLQRSGDAIAARLISIAERIETDFGRPIELPGPTGELNLLSLHPRGLLALLGPDNFEQALAALAAGNSIVWSTQGGPELNLETLVAALGKAGAPDEVFRPSEALHPEELAGSDTLAGVIFDGPDEERMTLAETLSKRSGSIIPILRAGDECERFVVERTLTVNLTAAGGDAALLADAERTTGSP